jgi:hypothetical protein
VPADWQALVVEEGCEDCVQIDESLAISLTSLVDLL